MVDIRINQLPLDGTPAPTDLVPIDNGTTRSTTIQALTESGRPTASQAEAEAGTDAVKSMSPLTTKQAVDFYGLTKSGNLAGLTNTVTARSNLGLGSAAVESASSFATAAQGVLADGSAQKTQNLADLANLETARGKLGDFATEAAFVAATIAAPILYVVTAGYSAAGDGGGHMKKRISTPVPIEAWHKQSADGAWWEIASSKIAPQMLGAVGNGVANDTTALTNAGNAAVALGRKLWLLSGSIYLFTQWVIPNNCEVEAEGSVLRSDGTLTVAADVTLTIGDNFICDSLKVTTPGTETNTDIISLGDNPIIGNLIVEADAQRAGGGIITAGNSVIIDYLKTRKIDRPLHLNNTSVNFQNEGSRIGFIDVESYVRAFRATFCSFNVGGIRAVGRSANASKSPGHNTVLIVGCSDWSIGDIWSEDAGEHAFRIGGTDGNANIFPNPENIAGWSSLADVTITSNASTSPDGTVTADRITKAGVDGLFSPGNSVTVTNVPHAFSTYVKYVSGSGWIRIRCSTPSNSFWVNSQTGAIGTINSGWSSVTMTDVGNGWFRATGIITPTAGAALWAIIPVTADSSTTADTGASDCWGTKLEVSSSVSSYIAQTSNYNIGIITAIRPGGCAFKVNPTLQTEPGVTEKAYNGAVNGVLGIDVGDPANAGNEELLRLTHVRRLNIGWALAYTDTDTVSAQYLAQVNDIDGVTIGTLGGENLNSGFINFDGTSDIDVGQFGGDVTNFSVQRIIGAMNGGNNAVLVNTTFNLSKVTLNFDGISGWAVNFIRWDAGTLTGLFEVTGRVGGSVTPVYLTVPDSDNFLINVAYNNSRTQGRPTGLRAGTAVYEVMSGVFTLANAPPTSLFVNATRATAGTGAYGGSIELSRPGSARRAASVTAKQITATAFQTGVALMVGNPGAVGNDALIEGAVLDHDGKLSVIGEYQVDATKVVGNRVTGWAAATGTATRTTFATGTVTTAQLAERVKALIDDLITHGLIGT